MAIISSNGRAGIKSNGGYTTEEERIIGAIQKQNNRARNFRFKRIGNRFQEGNTYSVEYDAPDVEKYYSWYYVYITDKDCQILENGEDAIVHMQTLLERKRSFMQRLNDFDFLDFIGALIALPIILAFVFVTVTSKNPQDAVSKEFLTIVSLILGYYFGRNKK
jgi:hypothetical protein